jgi:hypothetical protein
MTAPFERYHVYNLRLASNQPMPALMQDASPGAPDVILRWLDTYSPFPIGDLDWREEQSGLLAERRTIRLCRADAGAGEYVWLRLMMSFRRPEWQVDLMIPPGAAEMWIRPSGGVAHTDAMSVVLNPGLGVLLRLRGAVCLHGSSIVLDRRAIVLLGPKAAGKSTLAAAMLRYGASQLADDIATLTPEGAAIRVEPGFPSLRLWPPALKALAADYGDLPKVSAIRAKRYLPMDANVIAGTPAVNQFHSESVPLGAIYALAERGASDAGASIDLLTPRESLPALIANTFAGYMLTPALRRQEFALLSRLIQGTPIRLLRRPDDLNRLSELCQLLLSDTEALAA